MTTVYVLEFAGEDDEFAALEAASVADDVRRVAPGVATAERIERSRAEGLAFTRRVGERVTATDASVDAARTALAAAVDADPVREGTVAVRARDVRGTASIDTQRAERALGAVLVDRGYAIDLDDPAHELLALFADDQCLLAWTVVTSKRGYGDRMPTDRPFFQPGSMGPQLARALANLAGARPGTTVLDPMCGTGGTLIEAGLLGARVVGADAQRKMVRGTARNLREALPSGIHVLRADATRLPIADDAVDAAIFDAPYGRQSKIKGETLDGLVGDALAEARRVATRAVVVGDRDWSDAARDVGWTVEARHERRVHRSLTRFVHVLGPD